VADLGHPPKMADCRARVRQIHRPPASNVSHTDRRSGRHSVECAENRGPNPIPGLIGEPNTAYGVNTPWRGVHLLRAMMRALIDRRTDGPVITRNRGFQSHLIPPAAGTFAHNRRTGRSLQIVLVAAERRESRFMRGPQSDWQCPGCDNASRKPGREAVDQPLSASHSAISLPRPWLSLPSALTRGHHSTLGVTRARRVWSRRSHDAVRSRPRTTRVGRGRVCSTSAVPLPW